MTLSEVRVFVGLILCTFFIAAFSQPEFALMSGIAMGLLMLVALRKTGALHSTGRLLLVLTISLVVFATLGLLFGTWSGT